MEFSNILVRAVNWVGDAVMALPALRALRARYPEARITLLARPWVAGLFRRESFANETILYDPPPGWKGWQFRRSLAAALRARRFDCAVLLPNSFESALVPFAARIPTRIGYSRDGRRMLLTKPVALPHPGEIPLQEPYYYLEMLRRAGVLPTREFSLPLLLERSGDARARGLARFSELGLAAPVIGLSPGAANSRAKQWPGERFAACAVLLSQTLGASVALFGSASEQALCKTIAASLAAVGIPAKNLAGATNLEEFVELAAACHLLLTNDSGAMHIASAAGTPTVAIYGPTNEFTTGPLGPRSLIVREPVDCMRCMLRDCPIDHRCMTRVEPERVARQALELLK